MFSVLFHIEQRLKFKMCFPRLIPLSEYTSKSDFIGASKANTIARRRANIDTCASTVSLMGRMGNKVGSMTSFLPFKFISSAFSQYFTSVCCSKFSEFIVLNTSRCLPDNFSYTVYIIYKFLTITGREHRSELV